MKNALRFVGGTVAGAVVALVLVVAVEWFSSIVHPFPEGFGNTAEEMREHVARYPGWVLAIVVPAWGFTAFAGTWTAKRIGGLGPAVVVGALLVLAVVFNVSMLPYPIWFKVASVAAVAGAAAWPCVRSTRGPARGVQVGAESGLSSEPEQTSDSVEEKQDR